MADAECAAVRYMWAAGQPRAAVPTWAEMQAASCPLLAKCAKSEAPIFFFAAVRSKAGGQFA